MKRVFVSTVGRGKNKEESSRVYCVDVESGEILNSVRLPLAMFDLKNPRGGTRGARGLAFVQNKSLGRDYLYAAGFDGIFEIEPESMHIYKGYWSKRCQDIHQIYEAFPSTLLVTNTRQNAIWKFHPHASQWVCFSDYTSIHPGLSPPDSDEGNNDTLHFNSFSDKYGLCAKAAIVFERESDKVVLENQELLRGSHDIWELPTGEIAINNSRKSRTITLDPVTWDIRRVLYQETSTEGGSELAKRGWTRGMYYIEHLDTMLIGSSPAEVVILENVCNGKPIRETHIPISDEIVEATFDVIPHPEDWK